MLKKYLALALVVLMAAFASPALAVDVADLNGLKSVSNVDGERITLTQDITATQRILVAENIVLDLAGHTISASLGGYDIFAVYNGASMTVEDSVGNGIISSSGDAGIMVQGQTDTTQSAVNSKLILNSGIIEAQYFAVTVMGNGAQFDINGGIVRVTEVDGYAVSGSSGKAGYHGTIININGGELIGGTGLESDNPAYGDKGRDYIAGAGVFHSQEGILTMTGGTVSGYIGIQFRSGTLNMTGGTVISTGDMPTPVESSNGAVAVGAAIAFITNGDPAKVGYRGNMSATISGNAEVISKGANSYAIYEGTHATSGQEETTQMKSLTITGGTFEGVAGALSIENKGDENNEQKNISISGGSFSSEPKAEYLADGITLVEDADGNFVVPSLTLATNKISLAMNETITLDYTVVPANAQITWTSSKPEIATVNATTGEITAVAAGTTEITAALASDTSITAKCTVEVTEAEKPVLPDGGGDTTQQPSTGGSGGGCSAGFGALALLAALPLLRMRKK